MSAIFDTYNANTGSRLNGPHYSLAAIQDAQGWGEATMNDFPQNYDIRVFWESPSDYPVDVLFKLETGGTTLKKDETSQCPNGCKSGATASYAFPVKYENGGKTYELVRTYRERKAKSQFKLNDSTNIPDNVTTVTKTIEVSVGGDNIVGIYREAWPKPEYDPLTPPAAKTKSGQDMEPEPRAVVKADNRNAEMFNVLDGIPTSEDLYVNAFTKDYLYKYTFQQISDKKTYEITFKKTFNRSWTEKVPCGETTCDKPMSDKIDVEQTYQIDRLYSYWIIDNLDVYDVEKANVKNYALPNGEVTLTPNGYTPVGLSGIWHSEAETEHIQEPQYTKVQTLPSESLTGGTTPPAVTPEDWTDKAEAAIKKIKVRNDKLPFVYKTTTTVMNNDWHEEKTPDPGDMAKASQVGENVLYQKDLTIEPTLRNKKDATSSGTIHYKMNAGAVHPSTSSFQKEIPGINNVTVHTPVVNYSDTSDEPQFNQKMVPNAARKSFILDRPFYIDMPTDGMHRSILGYGNRDYAKYTKQKQVQFEFDVWVGADKRMYVEAGNWIEVPVNQERMWFFLPVWVDEGDYTVYFRQIAINSPISGFGWQQDANTQLENYYVATDTVDVEVIGRLYDFHITDIADYNWQSVFRQSDGVTPTGQSYWVGGQDIDGDVRGNPNPYHLSILSGSHPNTGKKNISVKTGYHFKFDMKTKGNMFGDGDGIQITPTFEFVYKNGTGRQPVDLYYIRSQDRKYIKIGSSEDLEKRYTVLGEPLRNVPRQEMLDTAPFYTEGYNAYYQQSLRKTEIGWWDYLLLTRHLRTFVGPKTNIPYSVDPDRALVAEQKWYGEYALPAAPYVVPANTNIAEWGRLNGGLDDKSKLWLRDGYIIVNFKIETVRNRDVTHPHLQYMRAPNVATWDNQWRLEGFQHSVTDPYGNVFGLRDGDVMFYHADKSSRDDFDSNQTH